MFHDFLEFCDMTPYTRVELNDVGRHLVEVEPARATRGFSFPTNPRVDHRPRTRGRGGKRTAFLVGHGCEPLVRSCASSFDEMCEG